MMDDGRPLYLCLRDEIAAEIIIGTYPDGAMLPSVRSFAQSVGMNPLTVAKAYQCFQDDGLMVVRRGVGMFVAEGATERLRQSERSHFVEHYWPKVRAIIRRLDLDLAALLEGEDA
jgi:GntR family transcriptional regulator